MNERLLCHAITGRAGGKELIMKVSINCQFIAPLLEFSTHAMSFSIDKVRDIKEGLYRIWCGMNRLGYQWRSQGGCGGVRTHLPKFS